MKILITGICGFVGSRLAHAFQARLEGAEIFGIDNLGRAGSELNRPLLRRAGFRLFHGDLRLASDFEGLPAADWVIDAAANPSVLAGVDGKSTSRQLLEHNLWSVVNTLEYCRQCNAGAIILSSSRVYSVPALAALPVHAEGCAFRLDRSGSVQPGVSERGISEQFSVAPPVSLYGASKLASETMALEYGATFGFPVWVNRCGVLAGAGQFGTAEQGIFSYWIHAHAGRHPLRYIGFGGHGWQVRDAFHPDDLAALIIAQMRSGANRGCVLNAGGGDDNSMSLAQLTAWCDDRFGAMTPVADSVHRPFDVPWLVMDSGLAEKTFDWRPAKPLTAILEEIAGHARENPGWLEYCGVAT
ncbi:MAG: NAD-dependent epimerase/dehydratase family protein [Bryobacterales bacterium]|nr:NAD-dependent epimerase/dehydratase family protein [Bryobacterales bacterium]MBV9397521.1 NAD-dependent epimerase/dehydratase family protein [Bryobacterales bacterium]